MNKTSSLSSKGSLKRLRQPNYALNSRTLTPNLYVDKSEKTLNRNKTSVIEPHSLHLYHSTKDAKRSGEVSSRNYKNSAPITTREKVSKEPLQKHKELKSILKQKQHYQSTQGQTLSKVSGENSQSLEKNIQPETRQKQTSTFDFYKLLSRGFDINVKNCINMLTRQKEEADKNKDNSKAHESSRNSSKNHLLMAPNRVQSITVNSIRNSAVESVTEVVRVPSKKLKKESKSIIQSKRTNGLKSQHSSKTNLGVLVNSKKKLETVKKPNHVCQKEKIVPLVNSSDHKRSQKSIVKEASFKVVVPRKSAAKKDQTVIWEKSFSMYANQEYNKVSHVLITDNTIKEKTLSNIDSSLRQAYKVMRPDDENNRHSQNILETIASTKEANASLKEISPKLLTEEDSLAGMEIQNHPQNLLFVDDDELSLLDFGIN